MIWENQLEEVKGKKDKRVAKWRRRIDRAIKKRKPHAEAWKKIRDYISTKGSEFDNDEGIDCPRVNKTRAFRNNRVSGFVFKNPRAIVRPVGQNGYEQIEVMGQNGPEMVPRYQIAEHLLNFVMSQESMGADRKSRRLATNGVESLGVSKVGYRADFANGNETNRTFAYDDERQEWNRDPSLSGEADSRGVPGNLIPAPEEYGRAYPLAPTSESWFWDIVSAERMLYDPDGENEFYDHDWVACEYYWPLKRIQKNKRFKASVRKQVTATVKADDFSEYDMKTAGEDGLDRDEEYGRVFEIWDIRNEEVLWYADGCHEFLAIENYPMGVDHCPYTHFAPDQNDGEWLPHPIMSDLVPINQEIDKLHQLDLQAHLGNIPKWGYVEGDIEDDPMDVLMSPVPNECVKFNAKVAGRAREALFGITRQFTPPDTYMRYQQLEKDFDEVAGQSSESRGRASSKLATGINEISQANRVREDDWRAQFAASLKATYKKMLDSIQANMDVSTAVAIAGKDGEEFVATITPEMIVGDFDVSVDIEDMMPRSTDMEIAAIERAMAQFGQYPLLALVPEVSGPVLDKLHINSASMREGLQKMAQAWLQMQMGPPPNETDVNGGAAPAGNFGDLAAQNMGGAM